MAVQIQLRRDTAANWQAENPVLAQGEAGLETDTAKLKFGDGVTAWNSLPYFASGGADTFLDLSDTPSSYKDQADKVPRVNSGESALEFVGPIFLADQVRAANFIMIPTVAGWTTVSTGAGNTRQEPMRNMVEITDVNAGSAMAYTKCMGFNIGGNYGSINWDKHLYLIFNYAIYRSKTDLTRRVQIETGLSPTIGQLAAQGIGFQVVDLAMTGESYGTARGTVSLGNMVEIAAPQYKQIQVVIWLDPDTPAVRFYINGSLAGSITNSDHIPSGIASTGCVLKHSIDRSVGGVSGVASVLFHGKVWQQR